MARKGQVTMFIIIGVILVLGVFFYIALNKNKEPAPIMEIDTTAVDNYIQSCLQSVAEDAVQIIGAQGGYIYPLHYRDELLVKRSFLYYNNLPWVPSIEIMQDELAEYVDYSLEKCTNYSVFHGYDIEAEKPETNVTIYEKSIEFDTSYNVIIQKGEAIGKLGDFNAHVDSRLSHLRDIAEEIIYRHIEKPGDIDYGYLSGLDVNVTVADRYLDVIEYTLIDENLTEPYYFSFYEQFDISPILGSSGPRFINLRDLEASAGKLFYHKFEAEGGLIFKAETNLFSIDDIGEVRFVPAKRDVGVHVFPVTVEDLDGNLDITLVKLTIR